MSNSPPPLLLAEQRPFQANMAMLAADIADHLSIRQFEGHAIVVHNDPLTLLRVTRKEWLKLSARIIKQRAMTLDTRRIRGLSKIMSQIENAKFRTYSHIDEQISQGVFFLRPNEICGVPICKTMYIISPMSSEQLMQAYGYIDEKGLIVNYPREYQKA